MKDPVWKIFGTYLCVLFFLLLCGSSYAQVKVIQFNAGWNKANNVSWCSSKTLNDCQVYYIDIAKYPEKQKKYKVVVVPTIIIFKEGDEVERYQADLSFKITANRKEVQNIIDDLLMEDF
jgi:DTW domain-containing protein YfiP|tara:strand:+ start:5813 stop:6172 length:360 start_codon:yes stop_codon:yes gene_type:complete